MMTPIAPADATDLMLAEASDLGAAAIRSRSHRLAGDAAALAGSAAAGSAAAGSAAAGSAPAAGTRTKARDPAQASSAIGIMLLAAVPGPPANPPTPIHS